MPSRSFGNIQGKTGGETTRRLSLRDRVAETHAFARGSSAGAYSGLIRWEFFNEP